MSVFVKGMNMPRSCWECNLHCFRDNGFRDKEEVKRGPITIIPEDFRCGGNNEWHETNEFDFLNERHPDCPITEIHTPHGRLIDADANVGSYVETWTCNCSEFGTQRVMAVDDLKYLSTIIEAAVSE